MDETKTKWAVSYETAIVRDTVRATEREAWIAHDILVCKGLNPDSLAVVELRS